MIVDERLAMSELAASSLEIPIDLVMIVFNGEKANQETNAEKKPILIYD